jgi:hypothetical protein
MQRALCSSMHSPAGHGRGACTEYHGTANTVLGRRYELQLQQVGESALSQMRSYTFDSRKTVRVPLFVKRVALFVKRVPLFRKRTLIPSTHTLIH